MHIPAKARRVGASDNLTVGRPVTSRNQQRNVYWQTQILAGTRQSPGQLRTSQGKKVCPISLKGNADPLFRPLNICASCQQIRAESQSRSQLGSENLKGYSGLHALGIGQPGWGKGKGLKNVQNLERRRGGSSRNTSQGGRMVMMSAGGKWNSDNLSFERLEMEVPTEQRPVSQHASDQEQSSRFCPGLNASSLYESSLFPLFFSASSGSGSSKNEQQLGGMSMLQGL